VATQTFVADRAIDSGKRDEARTVINKALAINPSSLEALSLSAGLDYVEDKNAEFEAGVRKVLAIAPRHGEVYRVAGDLAARNYRFDEAVALVRRALDLEPDNARSLADLGLHLLRTGDESGARRTLEASFKLDGFNIVTYNLLQMMDTLDTFVGVEDGNVVMRMHKDEAPLLQDYAMPLAHRALDTLSKRYGFTPKGPILVEIFPKHDDFAVRNLGLPGMIGALGACFGRVVTMDSPKARPPGEFQWEATLWHELAHVITLQMSNQRLPRWLSEGISTYEEGLARTEWGRGQDITFAGMLNSGEVIKLKDLNAAFQNPRLISIAYFQASVLVEYLFKTFGDDAMHRFLRAYGRGLDTDAAMKEAFNTTLDALQGGFDKMVESRFGALSRAIKAPDDAKDLRRAPLETLQVLAAKYPGSFPVQLMLGHRLLEADKKDEAVAAFERAAALAPVATGDDDPNMQIAKIALDKKDNARAMAALQAVLRTDFDNVEAARLLARVMRDANVTDPGRIRPVYERIAAIDPFDAEAHATLGRLALARDDADTAIREFRAVIVLKPVDQASAYTDLAEGYLKGGRRAEARKQTLAALEIAPSYERAQNLLLELSEVRR
jgi:Flp pilus assembly protein TadD